VLGEVYRAIDSWGAISRLKPEEVLGKVHCCPQCPCLHISGKLREAFELTLKEGRNSNAFEEIFACWNGDKEIIGLFGALTGSDRIVLLGEFAVQGSLPSYQDRLAKLQARYRAWWPGRVVVVAMLIAGIYLAIPLFGYFVDPHAVPHLSSVLAPVLLPAGAIPGWFSLKKYLLLHQPAVEPSTHLSW
jgi:hypothetical protein